MATPPNDPAAGLHDWCRRHAAGLAEQFIAEDTDERGDPRVFFEAKASRLVLTANYRPASEAVFFARILELEARDDGS